MLNKLLQWDQEFFLLLNGAGTKTFDPFWVFISSTTSAIPIFIFIIFLLIKKHRSSFWQGLVLILIVVSLADLTSVHAFKNVFLRLRPSHEPAIVDQIRLLVSKGGLYGFVSSHAANFFAIAAIVSTLFSERKYLPYILYSWATLVAYSRIYVGKHYPLDVLGGALLGILIAKIVWFAILKIKEKYKLAL
jgi:undecaprenyl-diphosphatase